jgi:hypothetical protein
MSNAETEMLRESIDRLTEGERVPAGLADRAFGHYRQRRTALRAAAATGTAVLAAAGTFAAVTAGPGAAPSIASGARPGSVHRAAAGLSAQTTAFVSVRAERALAAVQRGNLVEEIHTVGHNYPLGLVQVRVLHEHGNTYRLIEQSGATATQADSWYYRGQLREKGLDTMGRVLFDATSTTSQSPAGRRTVMKISGMGADYTSKTWWHAAAQFSLPAPSKQAPCKSAYLPPPVGSQINWAAEIRAALSCGHLRLAGHGQIGTVRAIKLVSAKVDGPYSETLWVNPVSYLPMRMTYHWLDRRAEGPGTLTSDFTWVRPTPANLGLLRATVPAGFRHTHGSGLPVPGMGI